MTAIGEYTRDEQRNFRFKDTMMTQPEAENTFAPVLTVMADYGGAPFLWTRDEDNIEENISCGLGWDEEDPMSYTLWLKFAKWARSFGETAFMLSDSGFVETGEWDWPAFHAQGLQLAQELKQEVGANYRVIYEKPYEDPNHHINERTEIMLAELYPVKRADQPLSS